MIAETTMQRSSEQNKSRQDRNGHDSAITTYLWEKFRSDGFLIVAVVVSFVYTSVMTREH